MEDQNTKYELSTGQILDSLNPLVEEGRLTGKLLVDGILLMDTDADSAATPAAQYDEFGFSTQMTEQGGVRIEAVERLLADWRENGDEFQKARAARPAQYYGIRVRGREYTTEQIRQLKANSNALWLMGAGTARFGKFAIYGDRYRHFKTGETKDTLTRTEQYSGAWRYNPGYRGAVVQNHVAVGWGNVTDPEHPQWEEYITRRLAAEIIKRMVEGAEISRRRAEFAAKNPNARRPGG